MTTTEHFKWDPFTRGFLRNAAHRLRREVACTVCDTDDYLQELSLDLWRRQSGFDAQKGKWTTYVRVVACNRAFELKRRCLGSRRHARRPPQPFETRMTFDVVGTPRVPLKSDELQHLPFDTHSVVMGLPDLEQEVCRVLMRSNITAAAQELGLPRSTVVSIVQKVRNRFASAGLAPSKIVRGNFENPSVAPQ